MAAEYIAIPYKRDQEDAVRKLLLLLRNEYDSKDPKFTKRYPSIIKAHMLLLVGSTLRVARARHLINNNRIRVLRPRSLS